jgi:hypothetical protein
MVGEEGRAQVTAGYRQTTEEANANHPHFFPLASMGSRTLIQKQFFNYFQIFKVCFQNLGTVELYLNLLGFWL